MKLNSWFSLATNAKTIPTDMIINTMGSLPVRAHLKYIRVVYEKIRQRGLSKSNVCDLMAIIRNHLEIRNNKVLEFDLKTSNHWAASKAELAKKWPAEKDFINSILKNVKLESILSESNTPILHIWAYLGSPDKLLEYKTNYPLAFKSQRNVIGLVNCDLIANGLSGDVRKMQVTFDFYQTSNLEFEKSITLDYCKFMILNNQKNMLPLLVNSNKFTREDLYFNLILPLFASSTPEDFAINFEKIPIHAKSKLLGDIRARLLVFRTYIKLKKFKDIVHLIKITDPAIINKSPDIIESLYLGLKCVIEKRNAFLNNEEKKRAFESIPAVQPKNILDLYPMINVCYSDLEEELRLIKSMDGGLDNDLVFKQNRRLYAAFDLWANNFLDINGRYSGFAPNKDDFQIITKSIINSSIGVKDVEDSLMKLTKIMDHMQMLPYSEETMIIVNRFFNMSRYIPSKWKLQLLKIQERAVKGPKRAYKLSKSPLFAKFRYSVEAKHLEGANFTAMELIRQDYDFMQSPEYFIMLLNLNIKFKQFEALRSLFRLYMQKCTYQDDSFYYNTLFSMIKAGLFVEAAELMDDIASSVNVIPDSLMIHDFIYNLSKLPHITQQLLKCAESIFSYLGPEKYSRDILEQLIYLAFSAEKDLDIGMQMYNIALQHKIKLGNWCYQHLLHIAAAHGRKDLILQLIESYIPEGGTIMPINIAFEYFLKFKDLQGMIKVLRSVRKSSLELDGISYKWILQGFAYLDSQMDNAEALWKSLQSNALAYSDAPYKIMIIGYSRMKTEEADQKMVQIVADLIEKASAQNLKFKIIEDIISFMISRGFIECCDYFLEVMHEKLNVFSNAEMEFILLRGYLDTKNVPMVLQTFDRLLECIENQSFSAGKLEAYESMIEGLDKIGQTELANKYRQQAVAMY